MAARGAVKIMRPAHAQSPAGRTPWTRTLLSVLAFAAWLGASGFHQPAQRPVPLGLDLYMPVPIDNPLRTDVVALGRRLFFEPSLSRDSSLACASCHIPSEGFSDGRELSQGVFGRQGARNVPTILNRGWGRSFFWDGRISKLENQVLQPILAADEMDMSVAEAVERLRGNPEYVDLFKSVFGRDPNEEDLARSLAAYVRTLRTGDSRFDRYVDGDHGALSELEVRGLKLFQGQRSSGERTAECTRCHSGATFTDEGFHNTGVAWRDGELQDQGRYAISGAEVDRGAFKTPSLRQVARTAPYMHDGSLATLEDVVDFYDGGGNANPYQDPLIKPLGLDEGEKAALVAFLRSLTGVAREGS